MWILRWGNPHTQPPAGQSATLGIQITSSSSKKPTALYLLKNPGEGYAIYCTLLDGKPRRTLPEASKQKIRRRNLEKRIDKSAPLFKAQLLEKELKAKPEYFGHAGGEAECGKNC